MRRENKIDCEQDCRNKDAAWCRGCVHNAAILVGQVKGNFLNVEEHIRENGL